jgi:predicted Zn-dependent peptidase
MDLEKYQAVTAEQIQKAAARYLNQTQRSIVILETNLQPVKSDVKTEKKAEDIQ